MGRVYGRIHAGGNFSGGEVFADQPLGAVPVEASGGVADPRKVDACWKREPAESVL